MISIIIPTLNSERTLEACLRAILAQNLPRDRYEIVVADAGSNDRTRDIARACGVDRIVENPLKTGEAGKSAGIRASTGDLIALVDSDNILPDDHWLERMTEGACKERASASVDGYRALTYHNFFDCMRCL